MGYLSAGSIGARVFLKNRPGGRKIFLFLGSCVMRKAGFSYVKIWRSRMSKIFVIHENDAWVEPLRAAFARLGNPFEEWFLDEGMLDLTTPPPEGVFYNRMSASSHTRGHTYAPEYAGAVIEHLERHGRTVVNGRRALQLELSKVAQYAALAGFDIPTPPTIAVVGVPLNSSRIAPATLSLMT
jgi:glutathione synthase/RimK-type ligase-like ATP-grasp enzyme